jgi:hypothetical protein
MNKSIVPSSKPVLKQLSLNSMEESSTKMMSKEKTIEETYQKKTQLEHILLRPDTYST